MSYDAGEHFNYVLPLSNKYVCNVKEHYQALIDVSYSKGLFQPRFSVEWYFTRSWKLSIKRVDSFQEQVFL